MSVRQGVVSLTSPCDRLARRLCAWMDDPGCQFSLNSAMDEKIVYMCVIKVFEKTRANTNVDFM